MFRYTTLNTVHCLHNAIHIHRARANTHLKYGIMMYLGWLDMHLQNYQPLLVLCPMEGLGTRPTTTSLVPNGGSGYETNHY